MNPVPGWNMTTVLAVLIGIVVFSMFMGNRSARNKPRTGWWGGLVVVLIIVSGVLSFTYLKRGIREERFADRHLWTKEVQGQVEEQVRKVTDKAKKGIDEAMRTMSIAQEKAMKGTEARSGVTTVSVNTSPKEPVLLTVELPKDQASKDRKVVENRLKDLATEKVAQWLRDRMPFKGVYYKSLVSGSFLEEARAFPSPICFDKQEVEVGSDSDEKDTLYGGSLEILLSPVLQERLIDMGYHRIDEYLKDEKLTHQSIIAMFLGMGTLGAVGIGFLCSAHRWWTMRTEPVQQSMAA
jgi:hypothetical protein